MLGRRLLAARANPEGLGLNDTVFCVDLALTDPNFDPPPAGFMAVILEPANNPPNGMRILWGDGTTHTSVGTDQEFVLHEYPDENGKYLIRLKGPAAALWVSDNSDYAQKIVSINQLGNSTSVVSSLGNGCYNLRTVPHKLPTGIQNIDLFCAGAVFFNDPAVGSWDTSSVTSMRGVFFNCVSFNQSVDNWDVSNAQFMGFLFSEASSYNQPINSWRTNSVIEISAFFNGASSFNQPVEHLDFSNVSGQNFSTLVFGNCTSFNQPLNGLNVSGVTEFKEWFFGCTAFNQPLDQWDTSAAIDMQLMFEGATSFNQNLNSWNTGSLTNVFGMFRGASSYNQPMDNWDVSGVTGVGMRNMFNNATVFNQNLSGWCVTNQPTLPQNFATGSALAPGNFPVWGTCPP